MHPELVKAIVRRAKQRHSEGDCPITSSSPTETLEFALISLAGDFEKLEADLAKAREERDDAATERDEAIRQFRQYQGKAQEEIDALTAERGTLRERVEGAQAAFSRFMDDLKAAPALLQTNALVTSEWHVKNLGQALAQNGEKG